MKLSIKSAFLGLTLILLAVSAGYSENNTQKQAPSLGEIARELKAEKAKEPKPAKVFTNDNLKSGTDWASENEKEAAAPIPPANAPAAPTPSHGEEYFRAQMTTLKGRLNTDQQELDVLKQKLGQNQMQYYSDPNKSLQQQYSREDVNKLTDAIDAKKADLATDNKAIEDLRDQLRHEGGDPGWLR